MSDYSMQVIEEFKKVCPKHGEYTAKRFKSKFFGLDIVSHCPECEKEWDKIDKVKAMKEHKRNIGIPERYINESLETFETKNSKVLDNIIYTAQRYINSPVKQKNMVLYGPTQSGKTHIACAVLSRMEGRCLYTNIIEILEKIKSGYSAKKVDEKQQAIISYYASFDALVIDNMEMFNPTKDNIKNLFSLLERRLNWNQSTIFCSQIKKNELKEIVGASLYGRMIANGVERSLEEKGELYGSVIDSY